MIVGISGKIGSGKDTVGKIIQYLCYCNNKRNSDITTHIGITLDETEFIVSCLNDGNLSLELLITHSTWQVKRWATGVKQVCSILTGIPVADFEKQEVKDRVLGEEWNKIEEHMNCGCDWIMDYWSKDGKCVNCGEETTQIVHTLTVRELLQKVGTDAMRNVIHENVWVNALFADYNCLDATTKVGDDGYNYDVLTFPNWIVTDTRFPNEAEAIKSRGGLLIRVNRPSTRWIDLDAMNEGFKYSGSLLYNPRFRMDSIEADTWAKLQLREKYGVETSDYPTEVSIKTDSHLYDDNNFLLPQYRDECIALKASWSPTKTEDHPSETALDSYTGFDEIIDNNASIEELIQNVKLILIKHNIV